jgi:hypothetical protein
VAGDGAAYFDPDDAASLLRALETLAADRQRWIERGRANAGRFCWADSASAVERMLDSIRRTPHASRGWRVV